MFTFANPDPDKFPYLSHFFEVKRGESTIGLLQPNIDNVYVFVTDISNLHLSTDDLAALQQKLNELNKKDN